MQSVLRFGYYLAILLVAIVIGTFFMVSETGILLVVLELTVGSVALAVYFFLVVIYFKTSRRTFFFTVLALIVGGYLWWFFDLG